MSRVFCLIMGYLALVNSGYTWASETREELSLNGIWNCYCEREGYPLAYHHHGGLRRVSRVVKIPVPGSLIDFIAQMDPKNCPSIVWYERKFLVPKNWKNDRKIWLRLDGVSPGTALWLNGEQMGKVQTSYVPSEYDVSDKLVFDSENRIALAVDTRLTHRGNSEFLGIPQSVSLRTVPELLFIQSVSVNTTVADETASITFRALVGGLLESHRKCVSVEVLDMDNKAVAFNTSCGSLEGMLTMSNCHLWWPMSMDPKGGYLYTLVFKLFYRFSDSVVKDVYRQRIGLRSLSWSNNSFMINGRTCYLQGAETNEEPSSHPFNPRMSLKDVALLKWLNANSLAMKFSPPEEMLDLADELGLLVILGSRKSALGDVILRYRNHPSVILWSVLAGEDCNSTQCRQFDGSLIDYGKSLDGTRPFTAEVSLSNLMNPMINKLDIVSLNLEDLTSPNAMPSNSCLILQDAFDRLQKPVIFMYGNKFLSTNYRIRTLKYDPYPMVNSLQRSLEYRNVSIVGEFYGNLVAYEQFTDESFKLVDGIFNRNREPTACADFIRTKFREGRSNSCLYKPPRCKFSRTLRKRV